MAVPESAGILPISEAIIPQIQGQPQIGIDQETAGPCPVVPIPGCKTRPGFVHSAKTFGEVVHDRAGLTCAYLATTEQRHRGS